MRDGGEGFPYARAVSSFKDIFSRHSRFQIKRLIRKQAMDFVEN
jgi:hypothetical protein